MKTGRGNIPSLLKVLARQGHASLPQILLGRVQSLNYVAQKPGICGAQLPASYMYSVSV